MSSTTRHSNGTAQCEAVIAAPAAAAVTAVAAATATEATGAQESQEINQVFDAVVSMYQVTEKTAIDISASKGVFKCWAKNN